MLIVSIICISGFTVAGGFSSQVSTAAGDEVLINSDNCGYLPLSSMRDAVEAYLQGRKYTQRYQLCPTVLF